MFLLRLLALPVTAPIDGMMALLKLIQNEVEDEYSNPETLRGRLAQLQEMLDAGMIDEDTYEVFETQILDRLEAVYEQQARSIEA